MTALIIDDEPKARTLLSTILEDFCEEIKIVHTAPNLPEGILKIKKENPDIVFLDIEMPGYNGTQIFDFFKPEEINFHIIFTTAHSEFAVQAFEMNAVDYLLKPMRPNKIKEAIKKVENKQNKSIATEQIEELKKSFQFTMFQKLGLPISDGILFVEMENIICLEADGMYCKVYLTNSDSQVISKPLKHFVNVLAENKLFYRPHRSYLINLQHIKQYVRKEGNYIIMKNDLIVSLSKEKREEFLEIVSE